MGAETVLVETVLAEDVDRLRLVLPPAPYSVWWLVLGVALVLAVAAWLAGVYLWTSPIERLRRTPVLRDIALRVLKIKFARSIDAICVRYQRGQLSSRAAHSAISHTFRTFLQLWTGEPASRMVLDEFGESPLAGAAPVIAALYPGQFSPSALETEHRSPSALETEHRSPSALETEHRSPSDQPDVVQAAQAAKEVLAAWQ